MTRLLALAILWPALAAAGEHWRMQYFYDSPGDSEFVISGLAFPTPQRGMAVGGLETDGKVKPYAVVTADGGATWAPLGVPATAISLFFVNPTAGWLVARNGIWRTADFGAKWTKLKGARGALRVHFRDERRGWAVGLNKSVYETSDGGATWKPVEAAAKPHTTPEFTAYGAIAFAGPEVGVITGWSRPPRHESRRELPDWMDPKSARREWPAVGILLQTRDGGAHWECEETSMFGRITALGLAPDGRALTLVEFFDRFEYPSEVYRIDRSTAKSVRVFRQKDRAVTDVLVPASGPAYLAAIEPPGSLFRSPVPGKLKLLKSGDMANWTEMDVDYRAVARRAHLAAPDPSHVWVATDTGMILKLVAE
jgi:photosystem II stability/assembly factor-like uncharacterized protein